jgi:hypothetical protein
MATLSTTLNLNIGTSQTASSGLIVPQTLSAAIAYTGLQLTNGTGSGAVDLVYAKALSLAGSATTLDLTSVTDLSGASISFARVRVLVIQNLATTAAYTVTVGNAASNIFTGFIASTGTVVIQPNVGATSNYSSHVFTDLYSTGASTGAYVDSTHKNLKLDPGANTISVNVLILGCSAAS